MNQIINTILALIFIVFSLVVLTLETRDFLARKNKNSFDYVGFGNLGFLMVIMLIGGLASLF